MKRILNFIFKHNLSSRIANDRYLSKIRHEEKIMYKLNNFEKTIISLIVIIGVAMIIHSILN